MKLHKLAAGARAFPSLYFRKGPGIEVDSDYSVAVMIPHFNL